MVVLVLANQWKDLSTDLATKSGLSVVHEIPQDYYFEFDSEGLCVKDGRQSKNFLIRLDLDKEFERIRAQRISRQKDLLCRAVGYKKGVESYKVLDGTFGLGKDAIHLAAFGCHVTGCEANPITFHFFEEALVRATSLQKLVSVVHDDTLELVEERVNSVDCLYLDPMFENIKKKSAPKKNLAFLREIAIAAGDVEKVMEKADRLGIKRMVVKRPINSEHLYRKPNLTFQGNLIRYDVYTR